ncbi:MAG: efflux RND transporter permease subunit, partial [Acidobacteriota bacterium]
MKVGFPRWAKIIAVVVVVVILLIGVGLLGLGWYVKNQMLDSGGPLLEAQAAYDVRHYRIDVEVKPESKTIEGRTTATVETVAPLAQFEINLDDRLTVAQVDVDGVVAEYEHDDGLIRVSLEPAWGAPERHSVKITYGGQPKVALKPPWIDGFVWSETPSGAPWVGVTGQGDGGDNWWPCKDHPSDEPDEGIDITLTVPYDLVGLSNGCKTAERDNGDGTITTEWHVSYPINNYLVTLNIAPYVPIEEPYHGIDGTLELVQTYDATEYVDDALRLVRNNIFIGGFLATMALLLFLRSLRTIGIIAIAIPISVLGSIIVLVAVGRSVNIVSLAGMAFAVGMVVDNAIVVIENVFRHLEMGGKTVRQATLDATREVGGAVLASTLPTLVVFFPILI